MAKTMKAAQFHPDTMKIHLETIPIPEPKDDEILVKTISSGLCHSDLVEKPHPSSNSHPPIPPPN